MSNNIEEKKDWKYWFMVKHYPAWLYMVIMGGFALILYLLFFSS